MVKRTENTSISITPRMFSAEELAVYLGVGRNTAMAFGEEIGAKRKIYGRALYDKEVVDRHFDSLIGDGNAVQADDQADRV